MFDPAAPPSDAELMARVARGERECFAELVRRYRPALLRVAVSRLGRADWAEDVVQETLMAAFKSCASYDPGFSFRTWLWTILLNQCRGHYQRRARSVPLEPLGGELDQVLAQVSRPQGDSSPLGTLMAKERAAQLEALLAQLTTAQADALRLRFFGSLKYHEIARTMQCSLNTAKNRVRIGLTRMAELIEAAGAPRTPRDQWEQESTEL
jgi:RNA polymerase sigma-70 factor (ECF subfamily)